MKSIRVGGKLVENLVVQTFSLCKPFSLRMGHSLKKKAMDFRRNGAIPRFSCRGLLGSALVSIHGPVADSNSWDSDKKVRA